MALGDTVKSDGTTIKANNFTPVQTGFSSGNKITYFGRKKNADGQYVAGQGEIRIDQANGAKFNQTFFPPAEGAAWAEDLFNTQMLHICGKVMSLEEYQAMMQACGGSFDNIFAAIEEKVMPKLVKGTWHLKLVVQANSKGQYFPKFPKSPNFIEYDDAQNKPVTFTTKLAGGKYPEYFEQPAVVTSAPETPANDVADPFA